MKRLLHPLLLLVAGAANKELVRMIEYLKAENRVLRSKLPQRVEVAPAERAKLVKLGARLGSKIKELITIVSPRTIARWLKGDPSARKPAKPGRPRKPEEVRQLIVKMAVETGWGNRRILGELKKLRIKVSRSTVAHVLQEHGFAPGPKRSHGTDLFCAIIESDGIELVPIPPCSPNMNPRAEAWVQRVKRECLDHFWVFGARHLRYILSTWLDYYHRFRPHQTWAMCR